MALTEEQEQEIRAAMKRCSEETIEAALAFQRDGDVSRLTQVAYGIIERYAEDKDAVRNASDDSRLIEDLGFDSLTILEIVLSIEEATGLKIENEEIQGVRTLGQVKEFVRRKGSGEDTSDIKEGSEDQAGKTFSKDDIMLSLPQSHPFLFVDEAKLQGDVISGSYEVTGDEHFLEGHFKDNPVFPASIIFEALGQVGCLWILDQAPERLSKDLGTNEVVFASMDGARVMRRAVPGDKLEMEVRLEMLKDPIAIFSGKVTVGGEKQCEVERLMLAFGEDAAKHLQGEQAS